MTYRQEDAQDGQYVCMENASVSVELNPSGAGRTTHSHATHTRALPVPVDKCQRLRNSCSSGMISESLAAAYQSPHASRNSLRGGTFGRLRDRRSLAWHDVGSAYASKDLLRRQSHAHCGAT